MFDDKDPLWMNDEIKTLIKKKIGCIRDKGDSVILTMLG